MSAATTTTQHDAENEQTRRVTGPASRPVTMLIQYGNDARMAVVRLNITAGEATQMVNLRKSSFCSRVEFSGVDLHGNPYVVEIGSQAVALYVEV